MLEKDVIVKRFRSCFICGVEIYSHKILLEDSGKNIYIILRDSASIDTLESFNRWFKNVYLKGIPQVLTVLDYRIDEDEDGISCQIVNKIVAWNTTSDTTKENSNGK